MMMEVEIERTKEVINGIEEACETVEKVLENVIHSEGMSEFLKQGGPLEEEDENDKMGDVVSELIPAATAMTLKRMEWKWYEREDLLALWNSNGV